MTLRPAVARPRLPFPAVALATAAALAATLAGCSAQADVTDDASADATAAAQEEVSQARLSTNLPRGDRPVAVDTLVRVDVEDGSVDRVRVTAAGSDGAAGERVPGRTSKDGTRWTATERLEPGTTYRVRAVAVDPAGRTARATETFRTEDLTLDEQTFPSIAPLDGETVGVGMPVVVTFDVAVSDRAAIERQLTVTSTPSQAGSWHWISDHEVHWRPKGYWKAGTRVRVDADVNGVHAGNGVYGQVSRTTSFTVGDAVVMKVDVADHVMRVERNGTLLRTIPVSAGKPGFTTRSGTKVIIEKFRSKRMDAATTGISEDDPEYYNIEDVEYALRVTYSGEFLHAAPWSVGSQGRANVSHGCVGMSTADAAWLYGLTSRGDVVEVTGTDRQMTLTNGWGDWNLPFAQYRQGSALS